MVRRKKEKERKRPAWGIPKRIVLLATPEGWRTNIVTESGMLSGRLDVPISTDAQHARAAAAVMVTELARDVHDTDVQVNWEPPRDPWSWTAHVTLTAQNDPTSPDTGGQPAHADAEHDPRRSAGGTASTPARPNI